MNEACRRDSWSSKIGIILAVAGSAIGLGNFLRFPVQAAGNGGGSFMIPYFITLFLIGIPLIWIEWALGRYGGIHCCSTAPGIFHHICRNRIVKFFGVLGIYGPIIIFVYYIYIESWLLGYCFYSVAGILTEIHGKEEMTRFLHGYQGLIPHNSFHGIAEAYLFFLVTFGLNMWIIFRGVQKGIELLCRLAVPALFLFAIVVAVRVFTMGAPDPSYPERNVLNGLGFLWNPDFSALLHAQTWFAAAGQVFYTLSVGIGVILTYASYLKKNDDIALSGITAAATNEFAEVILGGSIVIPLAFAFFGTEGIREVAMSGAFNLGFVTMPLIFSKISLGAFFCFAWFFMLFLAGITSSISLIEPFVAFLQDDIGLSRKKAATMVTVSTFALCQPSIFFLSRGVVNELDFWGGTFCLVLFGTVEAVLFCWFFGIDRAWNEIHRGARMTIPRFYRWVLKYITPTFLIVILVTWFIQEGWSVMMLKGVKEEDIPYIIAVRIGLLTLLLFFTAVVMKKGKGQA